MKPFNLERALLGYPIITRDGRRVTDFHYFKNSTDLLGSKFYAEVEGTVYAYPKNGIAFNRIDGNIESNIDLFMEEK